jgi:hypothetical protein
MIKLDPGLLQGVRSAGTAAELHHYLQQAVKLEHATIPPYLTAMFSLKPGPNQQIAHLIRSIVVEEMLHMTIASNILIATGGAPQINTKDFVPHYPGPLPMSIGEDLIVGIEAFSIPLVKNIFMAIEQPENEIPIRPPSLPAAKAEPEFATIGEFYDAIQKQIYALGPDIFVKPTAPPQVVASDWFPPEKLFPITDPDSACRAIDIIKIEGEGTDISPFQSAHDPAHFYKFGEIVNGRRIVQTPTGFAFDGPAFLFDPAGVWPLKPNCKIADFPVGTQARTRIERFAYTYATLLNALHETFRGHPEKFDAAIGLMYDLRVFAVALMQTDAGGKDGLTVGPSYEYVDVQGGIPA